MDQAAVVLRHSRLPRLPLFLTSLPRTLLLLIAQFLCLPKPLRFLMACHPFRPFARFSLYAQTALLEQPRFLGRALYL
jgi:hypothetical protein